MTILAQLRVKMQHRPHGKSFEGLGWRQVVLRQSLLEMTLHPQNVLRTRPKSASDEAAGKDVQVFVKTLR